MSWKYAQLHMVSFLPTKFHEILFSSFRGVVLKSNFRSIFGEILSSKGHNSNKFQAIKMSWLYAQLHMVSLIPTNFHEIMFSSFRGVALRNCVTDRRTDGQDKNNMSPHQSGGRDNNIDWKLFELQITLSKYCLARTDVRTEKVIPIPASAFSDAGKNKRKIYHGYLTWFQANQARLFFL